MTRRRQNPRRNDAMPAERNLFGLSQQAKARLLETLAAPRREKRSSADSLRAAPPPAARLRAAELEGAKEIRLIRDAARSLGIANPFFRMHDGIAGAETTIDGRRFVNFASYNYLGLNGHPEISAAAKAAIDRRDAARLPARPQRCRGARRADPQQHPRRRKIVGGAAPALSPPRSRGGRARARRSPPAQWPRAARDRRPLQHGRRPSRSAGLYRGCQTPSRLADG